MPAQKTTVHVIDDDEAVRDSLLMLLNAVDLQVKTYTDALDFLAVYNSDMRGCLVLDVRMPGMSGLELQRELNERQALLPIIFVTGHGDVPMAVNAMQKGAEEFLLKPFDHQELINRIHMALQKETALRESDTQRSQIEENITSLTKREKQVLQGLVKGKANKVIACDLDCSPRTVEIHRARVMEKMNVKSVAELVRYAMYLE